MNFCLCLPHCLSYLGEIQYKKFAHMLCSICEVLENLHKEGCTYRMGVHEIMCMRVL